MSFNLNKYIFSLIALGLLFGTAFAGTASLEVNVRDSGQAQISGAFVSVSDLNTYSVLDSNYTNAAGAVLFSRLPDGIVVKATASKNGYKTTFLLTGLYSAFTTLNITMDANAPQDQNAAASLTVYVKDSNNSSQIFGSTISVTRTDNNAISTFYTGSSDYAVFSGLAKNKTYLVAVSKAGYYSNTKSIALLTDTTTTVSLTKSPQPQDQNTSALLSVYVKDSNSLVPIANASVTVSSFSFSAVSTNIAAAMPRISGTFSQALSTNSSGLASFTVPIGTYTISASKSGYSTQSRTSSIGRATTETLYLNKPLDQNAADQNAVAQNETQGGAQNATLDVNVYDSGSGLPIQGALVNVFDKNTGFLLDSNYTDAKGNAYFLRLPGGKTAMVTAQKSGYKINTSNIALSSAHQNKLYVPLSANDTHYLEVTVYDEQGAAVPGAKVGIFRTDANATKSVSTLLTDYGGRATFIPVAEANYRAVASKTGYTTNQITTPSDRNVSIIITSVITSTTAVPVDLSNIDLGNARGTDFSKSTPELASVNGQEAYRMTGQKAGNLFGFIPVTMPVTITVNSKTNQLLKTERPWWNIFVATTQ